MCKSNEYEVCDYLKILIIDDESSITKLISRYLSAKGYDCTVSNDGRTGLDLIRNMKFGAVFLDLTMPDFSGFDVVNALEEEGLLNDQKIIIMTASPNSVEEINKIKNKVVTVLRKPLHLSDLLDVLEKLR